MNPASLCVGSLSRIAANPNPQRLVLEEEFLEEPSWESDLRPEIGFTVRWASLCSWCPLSPLCGSQWALRGKKDKGGTKTEGNGMGHCLEPEMSAL